MHPAVGRARNAVKAALEEAGWPSRVLVACSGGPDSLALAAAVAHFARRGAVDGHPLEAGAVVVDHRLQEGSGEVARTTAAVLGELGLAPVQVVAVEVRFAGEGPEAAARSARLGALEAEAAAWGAGAVLLGHTLDDQAEQVLLGLARGSGPRSLGGMRTVRGLQVRPFLGLRRADTLDVCRAEGLEPWFDPTNSDPRFMRSRVRVGIMPFLEAELGPGVAEGLARTAAILGQDADFLDAEASRAYAEWVERPAEPGTLLLPGEAVRSLPPALRSRVLALAVAELGGQPTFERLAAVERLLERRGSAGPVEVPGHVTVRRQPRRKDAPRGAEYGKLVFVSYR
ncbi:tRNA lysidine(34) synthetase TilS [Sinomonas sp. ASV322]|uniref:tRNA lysidine(34) synthetase TilS n=1 Tax=Sinomonas sp. ASV322 TaxID=3041920 RepID=UPI0027DCD3E7|nr:tRNA lysidine(34) synthetase TilS [Sinomonas sp. ASV322]MDQ4501420.1 tRNA lysidine(34) synthetase TilS [Sinomonas sp. ASV322]